MSDKFKENYDYNNALEGLQQQADQYDGDLAGFIVQFDGKHAAAIIHALKLADKFMQEPSNAVIDAFSETVRIEYISGYPVVINFDDIFNAMCCQMLAEIDSTSQAGCEACEGTGRVRPLPFMPYKGQLGFFNVDYDHRLLEGAAA